MRHARKLLLLSVAAVMVAFAAPAVAQAEGPFWYVGSEKLEGNEEFSAETTLTFSMGIFEVGPCPLRYEGSIANGEEAAEGEFSGAIYFPPGCGTNVPGCGTMPMVHSAGGLIATGENEVDVTQFNFGQSFVGTCALFGVPSSLQWGGTLKGQWNNENSCLEFENAGELVITQVEGEEASGETPVSTDGKMCFGNGITLE